MQNRVGERGVWVEVLPGLELRHDTRARWQGKDVSVVKDRSYRVDKLLRIKLDGVYHSLPYLWLKAHNVPKPEGGPYRARHAKLDDLGTSYWELCRKASLYPDVVAEIKQRFHSGDSLKNIAYDIKADISKVRAAVEGRSHIAIEPGLTYACADVRLHMSDALDMLPELRQLTKPQIQTLCQLCAKRSKELLEDILDDHRENPERFSRPTRKR